MKKARTRWTLTILLAAACSAALTGQAAPAPLATRTEAASNALSSAPQPASSHRSQDSVTEMEDRVFRLEQRIEELEGRAQRLGLDIASLRLRQLTMNRSRNTVPTREAGPGALAERIDEMNGSITRLTTLVAILIDQHHPQDDPDPPAAAGEPARDR